MKTKPDHPFEPDFVEALREMFEERIVFNQVLGLKITSFNPSNCVGTIAMRPELIGSFTHQRLHGGVISATLDAMGGLACMLAIGERFIDEPVAARLHRFSRLGTIDLRIDYLRPGNGPAFTASAQVLRLGSRVASTRMAFANSAGEMIAAGAAAYIVA